MNVLTNNKIRAHGFTLTELLIVVAVVGILGAIALPSYFQYVLRSNRTVAKTFLTELISRQESFRADRKTYATNLTALGYAADTMFLERDGDVVATNSGAIYQVTITAGTATAFSATSVPVGSQTSDSRCGTLGLTSAGVRTATGTDGLTCWAR